MKNTAKNKVKFAVAALGFGLASMSNATLAFFDFPDPIAACVQERMAQYCRATGQQPGCGVPTHIYYQFRSECV